MKTIRLKLQTKPKKLSKVLTTCSMTTKMMTTLTKKPRIVLLKTKKKKIMMVKNQKTGIWILKPQNILTLNRVSDWLFYEFLELIWSNVVEKTNSIPDWYLYHKVGTPIGFCLFVDFNIKLVKIDSFWNSICSPLTGPKIPT